MYCMECGGRNEKDHLFCIHCGVALPQPIAATTPEDRAQCSPVTHESTAKVPSFSDRQKVGAIMVGAILAAYVAVFVFTGSNPSILPGLTVLFLSLVPGMVVFLARIEKPVLWAEDLQSWAVSQADAMVNKGRFTHTWFLRPLALGLLKTLQWAEGMKDPYLRSGILITASLYFIVIMMYISVSAATIVVMLGIALGIGAYALSRGEGAPVRTIPYPERTEGRAVQDSVTRKCANCSNYVKQVWSVDFECSLGRAMPDLGDTEACRFYRASHKSGRKKRWSHRRKG